MSTSPTQTRLKPISLAGGWRFALDPDDEGIAGGWWQHPYPAEITLPGSLQAQDFGCSPGVETPWTGSIFDRSWKLDARYEPYRQSGHVKVPFWLQPERHYVGAAWYQRDIELPDDCTDKRVTVFLERCHWETTVWLDDVKIGDCDSLATPHVFELGALATPGWHRLTIRVDNRVRIHVGPNAHSISDHVQTNWNGIIGRMELHVTGKVWMDDIQVYPDRSAQRLRVRVALGNETGLSQAGTLDLQWADRIRQLPWKIPADGGVVEADWPLDRVPVAWDEFSPALQTLRLTLANGEVRTQTFGWREFATHGTQFTINGSPTFLRGTHDAGNFPLTGYPAMDVESWRRIFQTIREHGLNHVRYHSWCPPEAAFQVADELGMYLQVECGIWANQGATIGDGEAIDAWLYRETERILRCYGNHPSFVMLAHGNEPAGARHAEFLGDWVAWLHSRGDSRHLYTSAANYPSLPANDFQNPSGVQQHGWGQGIKSPINSEPPTTDFDYRDWVDKFAAPMVSHEIGQWCAYPNLDEIGKYTGLLRARNFEIFRDTLATNGMGDQARAFLHASGNLQVLCYRHEIEAQLRTRGLGGFVLLDLHDFPGQGTALVGMLDAFWESKGYLRAADFRRFCGPTVALARLPQRVFTSADEFAATVEVAHYGATALALTGATWQIVDAQGTVRHDGQLPGAHLPIGAVTGIGDVRATLDALQAPAKYRFVVSLAGLASANDWEFWVFPATTEVHVPSNIMVCDRLGDQEWLHLGNGGRLLLLPDPGSVPTPVQIGFSPIYWNTAWTINQPPHTLGLLCDPAHPALAQFPTDIHSNWQWWELLHQSAAMLMQELPSALRPIVQPIDDWHHNRRLGLLFEAAVNGGKVLVCSADLRTNLDQRPAARQLLRSLLAYMNSPSFTPDIEVTPQAIKRTIGRSR